MTEFCPKRNGKGHWWLCPTPDGQRVVEVECRECGETKDMTTSEDARTSRDYRSRRVIKRVLTPGKKHQLDLSTPGWQVGYEPQNLGEAARTWRK